MIRAAKGESCRKRASGGQKACFACTWPAMHERRGCIWHHVDQAAGLPAVPKKHPYGIARWQLPCNNTWEGSRRYSPHPNAPRCSALQLKPTSVSLFSAPSDSRHLNWLPQSCKKGQDGLPGGEGRQAGRSLLVWRLTEAIAGHFRLLLVLRVWQHNRTLTFNAGTMHNMLSVRFFSDNRPALQ